MEFTPDANINPQGKFVTEYSVDPANGGAFGIALATNGLESELAYDDDNQNTLSILPLFMGPTPGSRR